MSARIQYTRSEIPTFDLGDEVFYPLLVDVGGEYLIVPGIQKSVFLPCFLLFDTVGPPHKLFFHQSSRLYFAMASANLK